MAYVYGSAFYGIYFLVSFPGFFYLDWFVDGDCDGDDATTSLGKKQQHQEGKQLLQRQSMTLWETFVTICGHGMIILTLLDFVRLYLGIPLVIGGVAFATTK